MKTYAIMQLGCKVNDYEATYVKEQLNNYFKEVNFKDKADIYLIFTCCVTNMAEAKTRKFIHAARRNNKDALIVAIGCLSQIKGDSEDFKDCDLIIGSSKKNQIVDFILANEKGYKVDKQISNEFEDLFIESYPGKSRAFLKIQDGCNQFCNYCIIPYSRGRERSANHINVINQAKTLSKTRKEIVLTGIHTGRYNDGEYNLYKLLKDLKQIDDLKTIRLSSIEMTEVTDEIIELMKEDSKIAHHLHIPIQAASNEILKAMNRPYTLEDFKQKVEYIRSRIKNISISTDLIVGYPGESDEIFEKSLNDLKEIGFSFIHIFPYSRKLGTVADKLDNHIDPQIKKKRVSIVSELETQITLDYKKTFINKDVEILIEKCLNNKSYGYTKEYIYTSIYGEFEIGDIINAKIISVDTNEVKAVVIK